MLILFFKIKNGMFLSELLLSKELSFFLFFMNCFLFIVLMRNMIVFILV